MTNTQYMMFHVSNEVSKPTLHRSPQKAKYSHMHFIKNSELAPSFEVTLCESGNNAQINQTH